MPSRIQSTVPTTDRTAPAPRRSLRWRVVDIVVASVLAVALGVVFKVWEFPYEPLSAATELRYTGQTASGPLVSVRVELTRARGTAGLLELRVHRVQGRWLINDFVVDGDSFVAQHRARIDRSLRR